jgi:ABC-type Na+ transport system ATPase subunit NatA
MLLLFNIFETDLKQRVRNASPTMIKALYLSLLLAKNTKNIVIHDFIRGEEKEFELTFNRVLLQLKEEGKAILYITDDVFYAYRIADRVSFIKNGYLLPSEPIESKDLKELDTMEVYKHYLL